MATLSITNHNSIFQLRYILRFTVTSNPAKWSFAKDIEVSVHPKKYVKKNIGRHNLKVGSYFSPVLYGVLFFPILPSSVMLRDAN